MISAATKSLEENQKEMRLLSKRRRSFYVQACKLGILGSVAAIMDEPVIKYAIKQGRKFKTPIKGTQVVN